MGFQRRDFLHDMTWWEVRSLIRGYSRRHVLQYQLQRITAYSAFYAMRENKERKTPTDWLPLYFDNFDDPTISPLTQKEIDELQEEMNEMQKLLDHERKKAE